MHSLKIRGISRRSRRTAPSLCRSREPPTRIPRCRKTNLRVFWTHFACPRSFLAPAVWRQIAYAVVLRTTAEHNGTPIRFTMKARTLPASRLPTCVLRILCLGHHRTLLLKSYSASESSCSYFHEYLHVITPIPMVLIPLIPGISSPRFSAANTSARRTSRLTYLIGTASRSVTSKSQSVLL